MYINRKDVIKLTLDRDLQSIQEVRELVARAKEAEKILSTFPQEKLDDICSSVADACMEHAERLAKMAVQETGFGRWEDKVLKNTLGSRITWESVRDLKTVGLLREDKEKGICEIGVPMGVVAALIPSTNPTSTAMYKSIISIKAGNAIIISPHPGAKNCITETYKVIREAAERAGAPEGAVGCVSLTTMEATDTLLKHPDVSIILATGGEAMVHAAYSSGNPALGVGPGNGPSYIEHTADITSAVRRIMDSKTFDNGTICAQLTRLLVSRQDPENVSKKNPYSREKLCPILAYFVVESWEEACELCIRILQNEGAGHTMTLHTNNREVVREFAMKKPVSRILVNTPGALGGVGATTGLAPALTLGCGAVGGSATSDNITPLNLINIRRVAYGLCELADLRDSDGTERGAFAASDAFAAGGMEDLREEDIEAITRAVIARLRAKR